MHTYEPYTDTAKVCLSSFKGHFDINVSLHPLVTRYELVQQPFDIKRPVLRHRHLSAVRWLCGTALKSEIEGVY